MRRIFTQSSWLYPITGVLLAFLMVFSLSPAVLAQTEQGTPDRVEPSTADYIVLFPDTATITTGQSQFYTATAFDSKGNGRDVTADTKFSIDSGAGGSWSGNTYTSEFAGTWTVTGTYQGLTSEAVLIVEEEEVERGERRAEPSERVTILAEPDEEVELLSSSGNLRLRIPQGAVSRKVEIGMTEHTPKESTGMQMVSLFELDASDFDTRANIHAFNRELQISIQHTPEELAGLDVDSLRLYYLDEESQQWVPVATSEFDTKQMVLTATINHFTEFGEMASPLIVGPGRVMASQVDIHSGAAMFSYPIELPPGPGGFQPKLELTYKSGSVDEMKNKQDTGSWVGIGWTLTLGSISRDLATGEYFLNLNGASYQLFEDEDNYYHTNPEQYFKIECHGNYWELWDKEGYYYRFGGTDDSVQYVYVYDTDYYRYRWDLSLFKDTNNNTATVSYVQDKIETDDEEVVRAAYPEYLSYGDVQVQFFSSWDENDPTDGYLRYDSPKSSDDNPAPKVMDTRRLDYIEVRVSGDLVRKYNFTYNTEEREYAPDFGGMYYAGTHTLSSITEVGADDDSELPATNFFYEELETYRYDPDWGAFIWNPGNPASFSWPHLMEIDSGYGGSVSFAYTQTPDTTATNIWTREVVTEKTVDGGIGTTQTYTYTYADGPEYCPAESWYAEYRGFGMVEETDAEGNYARHWFYTTGTVNDQDAEKLTGHEYYTQWYDSGDNLLKETNYDWSAVTTGQVYIPYPDWGSGGSGDVPVPYSMNTPYAIAFDSQGYVYVVGENDCVQKFDAEGVFIDEWGSYGDDEGEFRSPRGIAVDSQGYVYVADTYNNRIQKFDADGDFILEWNTGDHWSDWFHYPRGIAVDGQDYIYVVDSGNNRVMKFDSNGNHISNWGLHGCHPEYITNPMGIAIDSQGYIYVTDLFDCWDWTPPCSLYFVQKFDSDGDFILKWGGLGTFENPVGIACDSQGYVYVADSGTNKVRKFNSSGNLLGDLGSGYSNPMGIAVDSQDDIYAVDSGNNRIRKFDSSGEFILEWGDIGSGSQFYGPQGIAFDSQGYTYVADSGNNRIQVFDFSGEFIDDWTWSSSNPTGVAVDSQGFIYVVGSNKDRIRKYNSSGNYILQWGSSGTGNGQFDNPIGIAVDSQDYVYVADSGNDRVQKFDSSGNYILYWRWGGSYSECLFNPMGIAIDSQDYVYVTDIYNISEDSGYHIQKYDTSGQRILQWGGYGDGNGEFMYPWGIAIDSQDYIYVTDALNNNVQQFDSSGDIIITQLFNDLEFNGPHGIAFDSQGSLYVDETNAGRIWKFVPNWTVRLNQIEEITGDKTSCTSYVYDDYGNVITQYLDGDISTNADDATVWLAYYPNTNKNILSLPGRVRVYEGIVTSDMGGANLREETRYYYDGNNTSYTTPPAKGNLTRQEQMVNAFSSVSSYFSYDSYGNMLTSQDANGNITSWTYDATYHTYPETITYPVAGLSESATYDPGTNNVLTHTDVNGQTTTYAYDTFKRLITVIKPGDSPESPTIEYQYNDWGTLGQQNLTTMTKISDGDYLWQRDYFDGLGRVLQTHTRGESGRTIIATTNVYNDRGLVDRQYVSQDIDSQLNSYMTPEAGWKYVSYVYDGLGRLTSRTNADDTSISHDYSTAWQDVVTNENGYKTRYYYDAFQRLVKVEELDASQQVYATTDYSYDVLNNLTQVVDNSNNITTMTYDWLSRKIAMTDPDMGSWSYGYDNNGNLTTQTDAKGQTITMTYDALNRITAKIYPQGSVMTDVSYSYDSTDGGNYGRGQLTGVATNYMNATQPPSVITNVADTITTSSATLNGNLVDLGTAGSVDVSFEWGLTTSYGNTTTPESMSAAGPFSAVLTDLQPDTIYHCRAKAEGDGTGYGSDIEFTTESETQPPSVITNVADTITTSSATLNGDLADLGTAGSVDVSFEWGLTTDYGNTTTPESMSATGPFSAVLTDLQLNTTYYFRAKAEGDGTSYGSDMSFTTENETQYEILRPNAAGDSCNIPWANGADCPDHYQNVDEETPDDNTTNVSWNDYYSLIDLYNLPAPSGSGTINYIRAYARCQAEDTPYQPSLRIAIDTGQDTYQGNYETLTTSYENYSCQWDTNPYTGNPWTWEEIDDLQIGVALRSCWSYPKKKRSSCTQVYVEIEYIEDESELPSVTTNAADTITVSSATLNGNLAALGTASSVDVSFEWGLTDDYGNTTTPGSMSATGPFGAVLSNLQPNTTYHFRAKAEGDGTGYGSDMVFTTDIETETPPPLLNTNTTSYRYDARGRLTEETRTVDSVDYTTQYTYDGANRNTTITYPTGEVATNEYNGRGLPFSLSGSTAGTLVGSTYYNNLGQVTEINLGNGLRTTFGYYGLGGTYDTGGGYYGRLWEIRTLPQAGGTAIQDVMHSWDAGGNLTQRENVLTAEIESFTYDFLGRLISASGPYSESYSYDQIGNITSKNGVSYSYGAQPHAVTAVGETSYAYDTNGNMITRGDQTITWDMENRVLSVTDGEDSSTFVYDGDGSRLTKTENGETILYINQYYEKNLTTGEVTTSYYLGDRLIAEMEGGTLTYLHQDHLTGTSVASDSGGTLVSSINYFPFGATRSGSVPTDRQFTGQRLDETELYYYGARYYDPEIGRFISADTIVPDMANPQSFNRYSYCLNNPLKYIDPSGLDVIIVGGSGSKEENKDKDWGEFIASLNLAPDEKVVYLPDIDPEFFPFELFDVEPRLQQLSDRLNRGDLKDITLIGFSEGAATVGTFLSNLADNPDLVSSDISDELHAAILLECPTGSLPSLVILNYDSNNLNNLPERLRDTGFAINLADIWNTASLAHLTGALPGWELMSFTYNSLAGYNPAAHLLMPPGNPHSDILHSVYAMYIANYIITGNKEIIKP